MNNNGTDQSAGWLVRAFVVRMQQNIRFTHVFNIIGTYYATEVPLYVKLKSSEMQCKLV